MDSTPFDSSNRKKSSKSGWVFIEKLSGLDPQPLDFIEPLFRRPLSPRPAIRLGLRFLVGDVQLRHDAKDSMGAYRFYPLDPWGVSIGSRKPRVCPFAWWSPSGDVRPVGRESTLHRREKTFPNGALTVGLPMGTVRAFCYLRRS